MGIFFVRTFRAANPFGRTGQLLFCEPLGDFSAVILFARLALPFFSFFPFFLCLRRAFFFVSPIRYFFGSAFALFLFARESVGMCVASALPATGHDREQERHAYRRDFLHRVPSRSFDLPACRHSSVWSIGDG